MSFWRLFRYAVRWRYDFSSEPGDQVIMTTRSMNDTLYDWSQALITLPYKRKKLTGLNDWWHARDYRYLIFEFDVDGIINMDEDCFVFDNGRLAGLLAYMRENGYDFCGVPDGGACVHRFHNPVVTNPFFNLQCARDSREVADREGGQDGAHPVRCRTWNTHAQGLAETGPQLRA